MGHSEDEFYEIYEKISKKGLQAEYDQQMKKMRTQSHHKHKEIKDRMRYACDKVIKNESNITKF